MNCKDGSIITIIPPIFLAYTTILLGYIGLRAFTTTSDWLYDTLYAGKIGLVEIEYLNTAFIDQYISILACIGLIPLPIMKLISLNTDSTQAIVINRF